MIFVLEDVAARVKLLERVVGNRQQIWVTDSAPLFIEQLERAANVEWPLQLIILDFHVTVGDGLEAARGIPRYYSDTPVLVWSDDPVGAAEIVTHLGRRRWDAPVLWQPFGPTVIATIRSLL